VEGHEGMDMHLEYLRSRLETAFCQRFLEHEQLLKSSLDRMLEHEQHLNSSLDRIQNMAQQSSDAARDQSILSQLLAERVHTLEQGEQIPRVPAPLGAHAVALQSPHSVGLQDSDTSNDTGNDAQGFRPANPSRVLPPVPKNGHMQNGYGSNTKGARKCV